MNDKSALSRTKLKSAEVATFGTLVNQETSVDFSGFSEQIIDQTLKKITKKTKLACSVCERGGQCVDLTTLGNFRVCSNCLSRLINVIGAPIHIATSRTPRPVRLYTCFGCRQYRSSMKMSCCLGVCRECLVFLRTQDGPRKSRLLRNAIHRFEYFLRRQI